VGESALFSLARQLKSGLRTKKPAGSLELRLCAWTAWRFGKTHFASLGERMKVRLLVVTVVSVLWAGLAQAAPFSIHTFGGPDNNFPFLGGIVGFASSSNDLSAGSSNYLYLGGTAATTPPGAGPTVGANSFTAATGINERIETAIARSVLRARCSLARPAASGPREHRPY
jgi:hypothetical protein